jgi:hypothetical protein
MVGIVGELWALESMTARAKVFTAAEREVKAWMGSTPPLPASFSSSSLFSIEEDA